MSLVLFQDRLASGTRNMSFRCPKLRSPYICVAAQLRLVAVEDGRLIRLRGYRSRAKRRLPPRNANQDSDVDMEEPQTFDEGEHEVNSRRVSWHGTFQVVETNKYTDILFKRPATLFVFVAWGMYGYWQSLLINECGDGHQTSSADADRTYLWPQKWKVIAPQTAKQESDHDTESPDTPDKSVIHIREVGHGIVFQPVKLTCDFVLVFFTVSERLGSHVFIDESDVNARRTHKQKATQRAA